MGDGVSVQGAPLFVAQTRYDEHTYRALVGLMMGRLRRWPRMLVLATGLVSVVGAGFVILSTGELSLPALLFLFLGNAFAMIGLFAKSLTVRLMMAGNKKGEPPVNEYAFYENRLLVTTGGGEKEYGYAAMRRVLDYKGYLVFFLSDGQTFLMRHADVDGKRFEALRDFLNARLSERRAG